MAEHTYEGMFLLDSNKFSSNPEGMTQALIQIVERAGGQVLAHRPWQDSKLAYEIDGHRKGMYFLTYFSLDSMKLPEITRLVKFNDSILRHLIIKLDPMLVGPMLAMASGKGDIPSTFRDPEAELTGAAGPTGAPVVR